MEKPVVVITGVTGYLGSATCLAFLQDGSFSVRGTVRSTSNEKKLQPLKLGLGELFAGLELVEADLSDEDSLIKACAGATFVVHTASPFHFKGGCVKPAVKGTTAVMKACSVHKVKRCVVTSSCAAMQAPAAEDKPVPPAAYNETCWSNPERPEGLHDYMKSKTWAERAAWDYQKANPGFDLVTILPCFIMGPAPCDGEGTSVSYMLDILKGKKAEIPRNSSSFVDVRDCAAAHLKAILLPEAANQRFILYNQRVLLRDVYGWLAKYNEKGAKVPTKLAEGEDSMDGDLIDNTKSREVLKIEYTPMEKTFCDAAEYLLSVGAV
ncbi:unnamed protein product [Effrenium voratum]|nr:unnamed protein product [Effrenium voratum]